MDFGGRGLLLRLAEQTPPVKPVRFKVAEDARHWAITRLHWIALTPEAFAGLQEALDKQGLVARTRVETNPLGDYHVRDYRRVALR